MSWGNNFHSPDKAFTLIELVFVIVVFSILTAFVVPMVKGIMDSGKQTAEVSAAKGLIAGYLTYAAENNNQLLPGFKSPEPGTVITDGHEGAEIRNPAALQRYAWRLAPYVDYSLPTLLGQNTKYAPPTDPMFHYLVSVYTPLGMNTSFVGGHFGGGGYVDAQNPRTGSGVVLRHLHQAVKPSQLIVFASAFHTLHGRQAGNFYVIPPRVRPGDGNNLDFRWNGKAVVACLDGHVEMINRTQADDMRRWSNKAAETDNPASNGLR